MAGLIQAAQTAPEAAPEAMAPTGQSQGGLAQEQASPEEQALYEEAVTRAYDLILEGDGENSKVRPAILDALDDDDPKEALAQVAASIVARVLQAAQDAGKEITDDVKEEVGSDVFSTLAEISTNAGNADFTGDDDLFSGAWLLAVDNLRQMEIASGTTTQEGAQGRLREMGQAEKDGRLDGIMRQLSAQGAV